MMCWTYHSSHQSLTNLNIKLYVIISLFIILCIYIWYLFSNKSLAKCIPPCHEGYILGIKKKLPVHTLYPIFFKNVSGNTGIFFLGLIKDDHLLVYYIYIYMYKMYMVKLKDDSGFTMSPHFIEYNLKYIKLYMARICIIN